MNRDELQRLRATVDGVALWVARANVLLIHRAGIRAEADLAAKSLNANFVDVVLRGERRWKRFTASRGRRPSSRLVGPLGCTTETQPGGKEHLLAVGTEITPTLRDVKSIFGLRRIFGGSEAKDSGGRAAQFLTDFHSWAESTGVPQLLARVDDRAVTVTPVPIAAALEDATGPNAQVAHLGTPQLFPASTPATLSSAIQTIRDPLSTEEKYREHTIAAGEALRNAET